MNGVGWQPGWLADQLPRPLSEDQFTRRLMGLFEEIGGSIRGEVLGFEHDLDVGLAPPAFVRWMGGWMGLALDPSMPEEQQRGLVRAAGPLFPLRGTRRGLQGLLEAFTGSTIEVSDGGGVFVDGQERTSAKHVSVRVSDAGGLTDQHLFDLVRIEVPADATFDVRIGRRDIRDEGPIEEDLAATIEISPMPGALQEDDVVDGLPGPPEPPEEEA
jgi:phage tail-like protein